LKCHTSISKNQKLEEIEVPISYTYSIEYIHLYLGLELGEISIQISGTFWKKQNDGSPWFLTKSCCVPPGAFTSTHMEYTPGDTIEFGKKPWRPIQNVFLLTDISKKITLKKKKKRFQALVGLSQIQKITPDSDS
jgi:hypothetical protein